MSCSNMPDVPKRICPTCADASPIVQNGSLWPRDWVCIRCQATPSCEGNITRLSPVLDGTMSGFDPDSFALLARVESGHFWFEERNALFAWLLRQYAPKAVRVLEIGCGTGFVIGMLREVYPFSHIAGSELHSAGLAFAIERHASDIEWLQLDAREIFLESALDVVCAGDVLEHIPEDTVALQAIQRSLRPGGILLAAVPQHPWLWSDSDDLAHHARRYRRGELEKKAKDAGFEVLFSDSFTSLLLPLMAASRVSQRFFGKTISSTSELIEKEFEIGTVLNDLLRKVLRIEQTLRNWGMRYPCGGSRIIIARRPE